MYLSKINYLNVIENTKLNFKLYQSDKANPYDF